MRSADDTLAEIATIPLYTAKEVAAQLGLAESRIRRWTYGNARRALSGGTTRDEALIEPDGGPEHRPIRLSWANLLELRFLKSYRRDVPLQRIRSALDFTGRELGVERPLLTVAFKVSGRDLFIREQELAINASRYGQIVAWPDDVGVFLDEIDYVPTHAGEIASAWHLRGRDVPLLVDPRRGGGLPVTASSGVRADAIVSRYLQGLSATEIADDLPVEVGEIDASLRFALEAAHAVE